MGRANFMALRGQRQPTVTLERGATETEVNASKLVLPSRPPGGRLRVRLRADVSRKSPLDFNSGVVPPDIDLTECGACGDLNCAPPPSAPHLRGGAPFLTRPGYSRGEITS